MSKASHNGRQPAVAGLRRLATAVLIAILIAMSPTLLCQPLEAGAASPRWPAALAQDVAASTDYTLSRQFAPARGNQQGLAFQGGALYVGYDSGDGINGRIRSYSTAGKLLSDTGLTRIGHAAELGWRTADGRLYAANGGRTNPTHVYKVNAGSGAIEYDYDFASLGNNGMVAVDNTADDMKLFYGPVAPDNNYRIRSVTFSGTLGAQFVVKRTLGVPQGIEVVGNQILYLYSKPWGDGSGNHYNWIAVYSATGTLVRTIALPTLIDESQGLAVDPADNTVYIGAKGPNAVYKLQPAFTPL